MTVIVWDGKTLAADRRSLLDGIISECTKLTVENIDGRSCAIAFAGLHKDGLALKRWFLDGADGIFPKVDEGTSPVLVVAYKGRCVYFEGNSEPILCEGKYDAWGCGAPVALGALAMGADAVQAVRVACELNCFCGNGVNSACL